MNVIVISMQPVIFECPCAKTCRLQPATDQLSEHLRRNLRPDRYGNPRPVRATSMTTIDTPAGFHDTFQSN